MRLTNYFNFRLLYNVYHIQRGNAALLLTATSQVNGKILTANRMETLEYISKN